MSNLINIQVEDRITFKDKNNNKIKTIIVDCDSEAKNYGNDFETKYHEILKIERPKYEIVEEKKELLTEEEKEFLKSYMKFIGFEKDIECIEKMDNHIIALYLSDNSDFRFEVTSGENFINLEDYRKYTLEELGLK